MSMRKDIALILLILAILALIVVPLGPTMLDVLLSLNLTLSVLLLIVAVYLKHPADFPTFPTVILLGTAFRLALSISTTRQILSEAEAGQIIKTFGEFVIAGNIVIGLIVFLIITVFQFLVITKGAERVAEVSARFALDAMPGKQMSIDADLRAEAIDKETAGRKREQLARESQFFGAMDGAMKFVKGDAIAGLIIIFINLVGGISVGMLILNMEFSTAMRTFTLLTLGDGLVAQLPALLMALCAGIVTTRVESTENIDLGSDIWRDLVRDPRVPAAAAGIVVLIGLIPGFPFLNFAVGAAVLLIVSFSIRRVLLADAKAAEAKEQEAADAATMQATGAGAAPADSNDQATAINEGPRSRRVVVRIGKDLAAQMDLAAFDRTLGAFLARYESSRGIILDLPTLQIVEDNPDMIHAYEVLLDEAPIITETVPRDAFMLRCAEGVLSSLACELHEVTYARWHEYSGFWVPNKARESALAIQLQPEKMEEHLASVTFRIIETNVGVLFGSEQLDLFLEKLAQENPAQRQQFDKQVDRNVFFQTLRYLAEDGVPLRPVTLIADTFLTWVQTHGNVGALDLSEYMRGSLKRQICHAMSGARDVMGVVLLDPAFEEFARNAVARHSNSGTAASTDGLPLTVEVSESLLAQFKDLLRNLSPGDPSPVVLASSPIRRRLRNFLSANRISLPVLAPHELSAEINVHPVARMVLPQSNAA